jgi:hypothetical protein
MSIQFEAYTAEGIRHGVIAGSGRLGDLLGTEAELAVAGGRFSRLDGAMSTISGVTRQPIDDFLIVVAPPDQVGLAHSVWHDVRIIAEPYVIEARLPTLPGFDPARALARPAGSFVLLGEVRIGLSGRPEDGVDDHELAWVNRYTVDRIESDLELGFFFPGAESVVVRGFNAELDRDGAEPGADSAGADDPVGYQVRAKARDPLDELLETALSD